MRWAEHVARMGDRRGAHRVLWGDLREREQLENLGLNGRIILKRIFKYLEGALTRLLLFRIRTGGGHL
jgi:hypothetical protein